MAAWVDAGFEDYARRMPREAAVKLVEIKAEPRPAGAQDKREHRAHHGSRGRHRAALPKNSYVVALDERGVSLTTRELARRLAAWQMDGRDIAFMIGGADGLPAAVKREADLVWSLSPLTLPHALARHRRRAALPRGFDPEKPPVSSRRA